MSRGGPLIGGGVTLSGCPRRPVGPGHSKPIPRKATAAPATETIALYGGLKNRSATIRMCCSSNAVGVDETAEQEGREPPGAAVTVAAEDRLIGAFLALLVLLLAGSLIAIIRTPATTSSVPTADVEGESASAIEVGPSRGGWRLSRLFQLIATTAVLVGVSFIFRYVYFHSAPSQRWPNVGAAATAVATVIAGAGLVFLAIQARESASAARAAAWQAQAGVESLHLTQQQFNEQLSSERRQQAILMFENITLNQTLAARGRLAEALKMERPKRSEPLKLGDLPSQARDDLFQVMRRFQLAEVMALPADTGLKAYVDEELAFRLIGWDIAWWYGALVGAFGQSLAKSGLEQPWESLGRLRNWAVKKKGSLATVQTIAENWVRSPP